MPSRIGIDLLGYLSHWDHINIDSELAITPDRMIIYSSKRRMYYKRFEYAKSI